MGLLQTMHLLGRNTPLHIYAPEGLEDIITIHLKHSKSTLKYPVIFIKTQDKEKELIFENKYLEVFSLPLKHKIPTTGFLFKEKLKPRVILPEKIAYYNIPKHYIPKIKLGANYIDKNGKTIKNVALTSQPLPSFTYAFCSDTKYNEELIPHIFNINLLYHEATFTQENMDNAVQTKHSTVKKSMKSVLIAC